MVLFYLGLQPLCLQPSSYLVQVYLVLPVGKFKILLHQKPPAGRGFFMSVVLTIYQFRC